MFQLTANDQNIIAKIIWLEFFNFSNEMENKPDKHRYDCIKDPNWDFGASVENLQ